MGTAMLAGRKFRLNPTSVSWGYKSKTAKHDTVGGRVVQIFGTTVSDITVTGTFGEGGWQEQEQFLSHMKALADLQISQAAKSNSTAAVQRFIYPDYGWDFHVMLRSFSSPDGSRSVNLSNEIIAPKWTLVLFISEDRSSLKKISQDNYLARLSRGLGWTQTSYNGFMSQDEVNAALNGQTVGDYITQQFGLDTGGAASTANNGSPAATSSSTANSSADNGTATGGTPDQNRTLGKNLAASLYGWTGAEWDALLQLWNRESEWKTDADNPSSGAYGIPQSLPGSKMASAGADWKTNPATQIKWGLKYIKDRYGSPSAAMVHENSYNWY